MVTRQYKIFKQVQTKHLLSRTGLRNKSRIIRTKTKSNDLHSRHPELLHRQQLRSKAQAMNSNTITTIITIITTIILIVIVATIRTLYLTT